MKIKFDYLQGPVLGHKRRCEILQYEFIKQGHTVTDSNAFDLLVVDYPLEQFPKSHGEYRLVMGILPQTQTDFAWHPLGPKGHKQTLYGGKYLIVNPLVKALSKQPKQKNILITCGGSDPFYLSEQLLNLFPESDIVIGPNFNRTIRVDPDQVYHNLSGDNMIKVMSQYRVIVCAWGQTVFEALALNTIVLPIITNNIHKAEAVHLGIPFVEKWSISATIEKIPHLTICNYGIDENGAKRTASTIIKYLTAIP